MRKFNITVNGKTYEVDVEEVGGASTSAPVAQAAPVVQAAPVASAPAATPAAAPAPKPTGKSGANKVSSPMPGSIVSVKVNVGDKVSNDTLVAVLEAMKMENEIFAGVEGTVASVEVSTGQSVNTGDVIITID